VTTGGGEPGPSPDASLPTGTAPRERTPRSGARASSTSATASGLAGSSGRFVAGTVLNERYRILGLLGKGGMGEVYRADDLLLGQAVALKFLPESLADDAERLERFYGEVRIARQISHPAVCRMHDVDRHEGQPFLTMEFVDGEDLKSLLRRIGRMPADKALEMSRQLCAGLAAAHERGVLHRDLKPENVMIDGQGRVRITDFGLAAIAEQVSGADVRSGTPAYMAPEQLAGREVTTASDLYALGLVLYELFSGRRAFSGRTLQELMRQHAETDVPSLQSVVSDIDPAVERVILQCLEKDPRQRPRSALAVAGALPGGDPLAAALAAGETPSPELVAAAGRKEGLRPGIAVAALGFALVGTVAIPLLSSEQELIAKVPLPLSPPVLENRALEIRHRLGYDQEVVDSASGIQVDFAYLDHVEAGPPSPDRWSGLGSGRPPVLRFWHRHSPEPMVSRRVSGRISPAEPTPTLYGMTSVTLDGEGRLVGFEAVSPQLEPAEPEATAPSPPDWTTLFDAAGLDIARFEQTPPRWTPPGFADTRAAWLGSYPERPDLGVRVEAAGYRGKTVYFELLGDWSRAARMDPFRPSAAHRLAQFLQNAIAVSVLFLALAIARRNLRLGRGDRRGALRLAGALMGTMLLSGLLWAHHSLGGGAEIGVVGRVVATALFGAAMVWVLYLAIEPWVRRQSPHRLISWTRLLSGDWRDPLVGRDVLLGTCAGAVMAMLIAAVWRLEIALGAPSQPKAYLLETLLGTRETLSGILDYVFQAVAFSMGFLLAMLVLRVLLRREWLAAGSLIALMGLQTGLNSGIDPWIGVAVGLLLWAVPCFVLLRFGLLTTTVGLFVIFLVGNLPLSGRLDHWTAGPTYLVMGTVASLAVLGFRSALAGRSLLGEALDG